MAWEELDKMKSGFGVLLAIKTNLILVLSYNQSKKYFPGWLVGWVAGEADNNTNSALARLWLEL